MVGYTQAVVGGECCDCSISLAAWTEICVGQSDISAYTCSTSDYDCENKQQQSTLDACACTTITYDCATRHQQSTFDSTASGAGIGTFTINKLITGGDASTYIYGTISFIGCDPQYMQYRYAYAASASDPPILSSWISFGFSNFHFWTYNSIIQRGSDRYIFYVEVATITTPAGSYETRGRYQQGSYP